MDDSPPCPVIPPDWVVTSLLPLQSTIRSYQTRCFYLEVLSQLEVVKEAVNTEESLLHKMEVMRSYYQPPLVKVNIPETTLRVQLLFEYLENCISSSKQILKYGTQFIQDYKINTQPSEFFSFITFHLWSYGEYTINYNITKTMLNELNKNIVYHRLLSILDANQKKGFCLGDLIIEPMQRTPRYPLLLNTIIKATQRNISEVESFQLIKKDYDYFTSLINEKTQMRDNLMVLSEEIDYPQIIIPRRYYIGGDSMIYNKKKCEAFLFNDRVIWFTVSKAYKVGKQNQYNFEGEFVFDDKSRVYSVQTTLVFNKFGLMPFQTVCPSKKNVLKWEDTINSLLNARVYDVKNENSWMNTVDCKVKLVSKLNPFYPNHKKPNK
ncbi:hypothetical protein EIN_372230 [Entamoeba invadens IP1]|uniref:DH domain-containing protein n=1 Tax=Entamoeba invadens IP1 TaxID=370355 RepID=A0A0A1UC32_ENTIV|nr:hypothetical protein EIN_372230 [Entamoeba invadens IP1]ELP92801.1 hypothetical protein EIN_372230 [Entamoeba invadens IP1]|eukprot:XP_004259572.1 hypothetical protein EIN_372230 [Entamoeba invadens IP1]